MPRTWQNKKLSNKFQLAETNQEKLKTTQRLRGAAQENIYTYKHVYMYTIYIHPSLLSKKRIYCQNIMIENQSDTVSGFHRSVC